nr:MAG TPA: hypothetical protein [Caudoviricetes sp.]
MLLQTNDVCTRSTPYGVDHPTLFFITSIYI